MKGPHLSFHTAAAVEVGTLHWHRKPCVGGGVGGQAGPANCAGNADLGAQLVLSGNGVDGFSYTIEGDEIHARYGCRINCGSLGDLEVSDATKLPGVKLTGGFSPVIALDGVLRLPNGMGEKKYRLLPAGAAVQPAASGFSITADPTVSWPK